MSAFFDLEPRRAALPVLMVGGEARRLRARAPSALDQRASGELVCRTRRLAAFDERLRVGEVVDLVRSLEGRRDQVPNSSR